MEKGTINGLNHICVYTKNLEESYRFYHDFLEFESFYETSVGSLEEGEQFPFQVRLIRNHDLVLELIQPAVPAFVNHGITGAINHIGMDVTDLESVVKRLEKKGIGQEMKISDMPHFYHGIKAVSLKGPSGETVSLYEFNQ